MAEYLERSLGWKVIERNWRCAKGELDLIALDADTLIVIEVRSRSQLGYGTPLEAVDERKLKQLRRVVPCYLWQGRYEQNCAVRVDAVTLFMKNGTVCSLDHIKDVLS